MCSYITSRILYYFIQSLYNFCKYVSYDSIYVKYFFLHLRLIYFYLLPCTIHSIIYFPIILNISLSIILYINLCFIGDVSLKCTNLFFTKFLQSEITNVIYYEFSNKLWKYMSQYYFISIHFNLLYLHKSLLQYEPKSNYGLFISTGL